MNTNTTYIITAYDYDDPNVLSRRLDARDAHLAMSEAKKRLGQQLCAAALLDDEGQMCGSVMLVRYPSRDMLDAWLADEPYMREHVWDPHRLTIQPCAIGPSFATIVDHKTEN